MTLIDRINDDLKKALLAGDRFTGEVLRGLKAVIHNEEVAQNKRDEGLDDEIIEQLIAKEIKKRNESAEIYDKADRPELASNERSEAKILSKYLPEQLSEDEIKKVVDRVISDLNVTSLSDMGRVIGTAKNELGNKADGAIIAKIVKSTLNKKGYE